jgi:membrane fusion protein, multidrug efflux system
MWRLLILFSLVFSACQDKGEVAQSSTSKDALLQVRAVKVTKQDIPLVMEFVGRTEGSTDAEIRARVDGQITNLHFQEGKPVKKGDLLYEIDDAPYRAELAKAQAALADAQARYVRAEADLKRVRPLAEIDAVSKRDLDVAIAGEASMRQSVEAAKAGVESAEIKLSYTKITSPVDGVIGLSKAKVGEYVGAAPNPVILNTVSDLSQIVVRLTVTEKEYLYFARLEKQRIAEKKERPEPRKLELVLSDGSVYEHSGVVKSVDRNIDAASGALAVQAVFPNPDSLLKPGLFAKIRVVSEVLQGVVAVPQVALKELQGIAQLAVLDASGQVEIKNVKAGQASGSLRVIEQGLNDGEVIAIDNLMKLRSGMQVKPIIEEK